MTARAPFSVLVGLVAARAVPLLITLTLFVAKVDGMLENSRWLMAIQEGSEAAYDDAWRNPVVAVGDLWVDHFRVWPHNQIYGNAAHAVARGDGDWYRGFYVYPSADQAPSRSTRSLVGWSIADTRTQAGAGTNL